MPNDNTESVAGTVPSDTESMWMHTQSIVVILYCELWGQDLFPGYAHIEEHSIGDPLFLYYC